MLKPSDLNVVDRWLFDEVKNRLSEIVGVDPQKAERLVAELNFMRLLVEDPVQVHHENVSTWASLIIEQNGLDMVSY